MWVLGFDVKPCAGTAEKPPWPPKPDPRHRPGLDGKELEHLPKLVGGPEILGNSYVPDLQGNVKLWYRTPKRREAAKDVPADAPLEKLGWQALKYKVKLYPAPVEQMLDLPDGRIFAIAKRMAVFDPSAGKMTSLGSAGLSVYSLLHHENNVYLSGYPSTTLAVFDPSRPVTTGSADVDGAGGQNSDAPHIASLESNPRLLLRMADHTRTHYGLSMAVGADGRIYVGGRVYRAGTGGGFGWYDPRTGEAGGLWQPFTAYTVYQICAVNSGRYIVCATAPTKDDANPKDRPEAGKLFVFDVGRREVAREICPVAKGATGPVVEVAPGLLMGLSRDPDTRAGILYGVEVDSGKVLWTKSLPLGYPMEWGPISHASEEYRLGPDGNVWTWMDDGPHGAVLTRIAPSDTAVTFIGRTTDRTGRLAFSKGEVYIGGTGWLRRVRMPAQ